MSAGWQKKEWSEILKEYSSGEDSDEHDSLNVRSVQKNAGRVTDLLHAMIPVLDPSRSKSLPMGMNNVDFIREGLADAMLERSHHLREFPATSVSASDDARTETRTSSDAPPPSPKRLPPREDVTGIDSEHLSNTNVEEGVVV